ncbi:MAG: hypothetical protein AAF546_08755 [Verrucomicrobiota bacterium]
MQITEATPLGKEDEDTDLIPAIFNPSGHTSTEPDGALLEAVSVERKLVSTTKELPPLEISKRNYPSLNRLDKEASAQKSMQRLSLTVPPETINGPSAKIRCLLYVDANGNFVDVEIMNKDDYGSTSEAIQLLVDYLREQVYPRALKDGEPSSYRTVRMVTLKSR